MHAGKGRDAVLLAALCTVPGAVDDPVALIT